MSNILFSVITFTKIVDVPNSRGSIDKMRHSRTLGIFDSKDEAIEIITTNHCDIYEAGFYPYAAVERVNKGLYGLAKDEDVGTKQIWFKWSKEKGGYKQIDARPEDLDRVHQFTLA